MFTRIENVHVLQNGLRDVDLDGGAMRELGDVGGIGKVNSHPVAALNGWRVA
jgi:hypothetical protein